MENDNIKNPQTGVKSDEKKVDTGSADIGSSFNKAKEGLTDLGKKGSDYLKGNK